MFSLVLHWLFRVTEIFVLLALSYLAYHVLRRGWLAVQEFSLLANLVVGTRYSGIPKNKRLRVYVVPSHLVDTVTTNEVFNLVNTVSEGRSVSVKYLHKKMRDYQYTFFYRDCMDGSLRGLLMGSAENKERDGKKYGLITLGIGYFQKDYTGGPLLYATGLYYCMKQLVLHPFTPLFVRGSTFSYMSYSFIAANFTTFYPRHDCTIPPFEKSLIDEEGSNFEKYNPEKCVSEREGSRLQEYVAPITDEKLKNPHTRFFNEKNPGWKKGHVMVVLAEVRWKDLLTMCWSMLKKGYQKSKHARSTKIIRYGSRRSVSHFVTERAFLKQERAFLKQELMECDHEEASCSDLEDDIFHTSSATSLQLEDIPEEADEDCDGAPRDLKRDRGSRDVKRDRGLRDLKKYAADTHDQRNYTTRTRSIALGVDRIDEYSYLEVTTP